MRRVPLVPASIAFALALAAAACEGGGGGTSPHATRRVVRFEAPHNCEPMFGWCDATVAPAVHPVRVAVTDEESGAPVADAEVRLALVGGSGVLGATTLRTGADGIARTTLAVADSGTRRVVASTRWASDAEYRLAVFPPLRVVLNHDPIEVEQGCALMVETELSGGGRANFIGEYVDFSTADTTVAWPGGVGGSGSFRGHRANVFGRRPGVTRLVAHYQGAADTAEVRVAPPGDLRVFLTAPAEPGGTFPATLSVGATVSLWAEAMNGACGWPPERLPVDLRSSDPAVARIDAGNVLVAAAPGTVTITAVSGGARTDHVLTVQ